MINKLTYIESMQTHPYRNLALEEYLLLHAQAGECILYLWQNRQTVVIGRNQNAWKECKFEQLERDGGSLVRRLSGGGAVFHDLGNLNFTFLVREADYDVQRQLEVILRAVRSFGIDAEKTGRNDLTIGGKKFSGNAFYETHGCCYHHGTIMVSVNTQDLSKYLNVSMDKLKSKGVDSVRSRVANLTDFNPEVTIGRLRERLIAAFGEVYGLTPAPYPADTIPSEEIARAEKQFSSWQWIFGRKIPFSFEISKRFGWGDFTLQLSVEGGFIRDVVVYSDSMHPGLITELPGKLRDIPLTRQAVCDAIGAFRDGLTRPEEEQIVREICGFVGEQNF